MKNIAVILTAAAVLALAPRAGYAQSGGRFTVGGTIDYARITDDESFLGSGISGAGNLGWRLTDRTSLEIEAGRTRHVRHRAAQGWG